MLLRDCRALTLYLTYILQPEATNASPALA